MWTERFSFRKSEINRNNAETDSKHNRKEIGYVFQTFSPNVVGKTDGLEG